MSWSLPASWTVLVPAYALVIITPGPNLFVLLRASMASPGASPGTAIPASVAGIACGVGLAALGALLGSAALLHGTAAATGELETLGRAVFAALLARAGWRTLRRAWADRRAAPAPQQGRAGMRRAAAPFRLALLVALTNPVTLSFFTGFFLGHPEARQGWGGFASCALVALMAGGWFGLLGLLLTRPGARRHLVPAGRWPAIALGGALLACAAVTIRPVL